MRVLECFSKILSLLFLLNSGITSAYVIERKGDEFLLPPYLRDYNGGILNVITEQTTDKNNKRSAQPGEWLEYGDSFATPDRMSLYVLMNEGLQWVGGGVFEGKIINGKWNLSKPLYEMEVNRGWVRVWAKPSTAAGPLQIKTPKITLIVNEGSFWISVNPQKTEVYVLSGTVKGDDQTCTEDKFYEWSGAPAKLQKTSEKWDFVSLEKRIAEAYPSLITLSHRANEDWVEDISSKKYADLRSKGWKKADRYFPTPTPQK